MGRHGLREIVSILKESSLYVTLSASERRSLLKSLAQNYPNLVEGKDEETEIGYEASWAGIIDKQ